RANPGSLRPVDQQAVQHWGYQQHHRLAVGLPHFMAEDSAKAITTYLTYSHQTYWDARTQDRYGLSTSKLFSIGDISNITASLSAYRT
ncbi:hypothetical protein, partial [Enterobacter hormaechei]|uniref:hypothetical protein n=1 Tax=Enterobacter hormaechei TaxID=158836 RepID=UPI0013FD105B